MESSVLKKVKLFLNIQDELQDDLLVAIKEQTEQHLKALCGVDDIPSTLEFVVVDVMVMRFNRIGSEGMQSQSVDGLSQTFNSDDFENYKGVIQNFVAQQKVIKGVKFL